MKYNGKISQNVLENKELENCQDITSLGDLKHKLNSDRVKKLKINKITIEFEKEANK